MNPLTEDAIADIFNNIIQRVVEDVGGGFVCDEIQKTGLCFTDENPSYARIELNTIFFSRPCYLDDFACKCKTEYKCVLSRIGMPFYCDECGNWQFLTPEPEVYTLLHELAHIITEMMHDRPGAHGKEFCESYLYLLELVQPKMFSPSPRAKYVMWGEASPAQEATA